MKKTILPLLLSFVLLVAFGPVAGAEMAKEGTGSGTNIYSGTITMVPFDKAHSALIYESLGVFISDTGKGPFHNMSTRNIGVIYFAKGEGKLLGYVIMTAPDGDKVLCEIKEDKTLPPPNPNKGTGKFLWGTGKFAGITGTLEYTRYNTRPAKKGTAQGVSRSKSHWKLPETKK